MPLTLEIAEMNLGNFLGCFTTIQKRFEAMLSKKGKVKPRCINPLIAMKLLRVSFLQEQTKARYVTFSM
jgi:hypothetical protein